MVSERSLQQYPEMPLPQQDWHVIVPNPLLNEQLACDQEAMSNRVEHNYPDLNPEQKIPFDNVVNSAKNNEGNIFFLHSAGGCGKTHISKTIAAAINADGHIALCVASSAIAALLLHGGHTAHSHFKFPWDKAPMQHCYGPEALDHTLRDLFKTNGQHINQVPLFGDITVMFVGDSRQTLPIVKRGSMVQIVNASLHK